MSLPTLEKKTAVDAGSDLASLVIVYHRQHHEFGVEVSACGFDMCRVADQCIKLDEAFYGTGD